MPRALRRRSCCLLDGRLHPLLRGEAAVEDVVAALRKPRDIVQGAEHHLVAPHGVSLAVEGALAEAGPVGGSDLVAEGVAFTKGQKGQVAIRPFLSKKAIFCYFLCFWPFLAAWPFGLFGLIGLIASNLMWRLKACRKELGSSTPACLASWRRLL